MNRSETIVQAQLVITGERHDNYGDAKDNFTNIASGWSKIIDEAYRVHGEITPMHVALMMDWVKTCRLLNDIENEDPWVDKIGYSALGSEIAETYGQD